jgi:hypothetical protein
MATVDTCFLRMLELPGGLWANYNDNLEGRLAKTFRQTHKDQHKIMCFFWLATLSRVCVCWGAAMSRLCAFSWPSNLEIWHRRSKGPTCNLASACGNFLLGVGSGWRAGDNQSLRLPPTEFDHIRAIDLICVAFPQGFSYTPTWRGLLNLLRQKLARSETLANTLLQLLNFGIETLQDLIMF